MAIDRKGIMTVRVKVNIESTSVSEVIRILTNAAAGLDNASVDFDCYDDYGSARCDVYVEGKRKATKEEKALEAERLREGARMRRLFEDRQIEHLRRARPEVFKDV